MDKIEKEFNNLINSIDEDYLHQRCLKLGVKHNKNDNLFMLCYKYLKKKSSIPDWKLNADEFINPDIILKDEGIKLIVYRITLPHLIPCIEENIKSIISKFLYYEKLINISTNIKNRRRSK